MAQPESHEKTVISRRCLACGGHYVGETVCPKDGNVLTNSTAECELEIGSTFAGRFEIISRLGEGGMGVVYKARQMFLNQLVAVKLLNAAHVANQQTTLRFQQEGRAASSLNHPNVAKVHDFGISDTGQPYLVMDFIEGKSLAEILAEEGSLTVKRCLNIFRPVCAALAHAHAHSIIHRDIKPSNIMVHSGANGVETVKLVDFGIAKILRPDVMADKDRQTLTATGEVFGSPYYMSPEQCLGEALDARSDIYALGCVMYQSLTGEVPHAGKSPFETMQKRIVSNAKPFYAVRPELIVPGALETAVMVCLSRKPEERFQSMDELKEALDAVSDERTAENTKPHSLKWRVLHNRSKRILLRRSSMFIVLLLAGMAGIVILLWAWHERTQHIVFLEFISPGDEALLTNNYREALTHYQNGLVRAEETLFDDDTTEMVLDRLGLYYHRRGMFSEAEGAFQRALDMRLASRKSFSFVPPDEQAVAVNYDNLAVQQMKLHKLDQAESNFTRARRIFEKLQSQQHASPERFANCLHRYAVLLAEKGNNQAAEEMEKHARQLEAQ